MERPGALPVEAEVLGVGRGQQERQLGGHELPDERGVGIWPVTKSLVRHVDEGDQLPRTNHLHHLIPLRVLDEHLV